MEGTLVNMSPRFWGPEDHCLDTLRFFRLGWSLAACCVTSPIMILDSAPSFECPPGPFLWRSGAASTSWASKTNQCMPGAQHIAERGCLFRAIFNRDLMPHCLSAARLLLTPRGLMPRGPRYAAKAGPTKPSTREPADAHSDVGARSR